MNEKVRHMTEKIGNGSNILSISSSVVSTFRLLPTHVFRTSIMSEKSIGSKWYVEWQSLRKWIMNERPLYSRIVTITLLTLPHHWLRKERSYGGERDEWWGNERDNIILDPYVSFISLYSSLVSMRSVYEWDGGSYSMESITLSSR